MKASHIIPWVLYKLTGKHRYLPEIEWSSNSWTHNLFRVLDLVFWRAYGKNGIGDTIRRESAVKAEMIDGIVYIERHFFTVEAVVAHAEAIARQAFAKAMEPKPQYGFMPQPVFLTLAVLGLKLSLHGDMNGFLAPFIGMAIAYDTSDKSTGVTTSLSFSFTTSGTNRLLMICGQLQDNSRSWSSITYAGNATTQIGSNITYIANSAPGQMRYQVAPTTGANNAVFTPSGSINTQGYCVNYTGCSQTGVPDGTNQNSGSTSMNVTVTATNCWMTAFMVGFNNTFDNVDPPSKAVPAGALTRSLTFTNDGACFADSNGTISTGSIAVSVTNLNANNGKIAASIAPSAAVAATGYLPLMGVGS